MYRYCVLFYHMIIFLFKLNAQFYFPIDTIDITGNFGEIRNHHFHQGIDFSTKGEENLPVKSIDDGYVYRIKISSVGYGKALYIYHPSGLLSVYAHLNSFSEKIQSALTQYLIANQLNEIDLSLKEDSIPIKKGEIIGFSGNTGSSTGPHLHFEIRNELTEIPLNPLFYLDINDTTKPVIENILFYDLSDTLQPKPMFSKNNKTDTFVVTSSIIGVAFSGYDKMYSKGNPNNIYKVQLFLDDKKIYQHRLHYITFDNTIYVEYYSDKIKHQNFQKCFATHLYPVDFYDTLINKGRIVLSDTNYHTLRLIACDEKNNCTEKIIHIKTKKFSSYKIIHKKNLILCTEPYLLKTKYFEFSLPEKSLYNDIYATFQYNIEKKKIEFSHSPISLRYPAKLIIRHQIPIVQLKHTLLVSQNRYYVPDSYTVEEITFSVNEMSDYYLYTDIKIPTIKPLNYNKKFKSIMISDNTNQLYFILSDNTKVKEYRVYLNNQFCRSYYYASKKRLVVELPKELIASDEYIMQVIATDIAGNTTRKSYNIKFK